MTLKSAPKTSEQLCSSLVNLPHADYIGSIQTEDTCFFVLHMLGILVISIIIVLTHILNIH